MAGIALYPKSDPSVTSVPNDTVVGDVVDLMDAPEVSNLTNGSGFDWAEDATEGAGQGFLENVTDILQELLVPSVTEQAVVITPVEYNATTAPHLPVSEDNSPGWFVATIDATIRLAEELAVQSVSAYFEVFC
jgi:hypothetical protein